MYKHGDSVIYNGIVYIFDRYFLKEKHLCWLKDHKHPVLVYNLKHYRGVA